MAHHRAGRLAQAESLYRQILLLAPGNPEAQYRLGNVCLDRGRLDEAVSCYRRALAENPDLAEAHGNLGNILRAQGKPEEAAASYRKALDLRPDFFVVHYNLGNALNDLGRLEEAASSFRRAMALKPDFVQAYVNLGVILHDQGKLDMAAANFRRALGLRPDLAEAHCNLGKILHDQGKPEEAVASYRKALGLRPDFAEAYSHLGVTLHAQGKLEEAMASYRRALALKPDFVEALNNLGSTLHDQGKVNDAEACFRRALALNPESAEVLNHLGVTLYDQGRLDEAEASIRRALALKPGLADAYNNLGNVLKDRGKSGEAIVNFRRALELKPDLAKAHNNLGNVLKDIGEAEEALASYRRALELRPDWPRVHSNLLLCSNYLVGRTVAEYLEEARRYGRRVTAKADGTRFTDWSCAAKPERLRVGLVSGDFRNHSVGYFLETVLAEIDPARVELFAYSTHYLEDALTARLRSRFKAWNSLVGLPDEAAARRIHDDGVHILFDLAGHTSHNRLPVFAWKPAPVQVSWLGYSASTGVAEIDYLLADPHVVPAGKEGHFSETVLRLPESYLCFAPPSQEVAVGPLPALKEGAVTFGSFNNPAKINEPLIALWANILHGVPGSRLILKARQFLDGAFSEKMHQRFLTCGIAPERVLLEGFSPRREEHLAVYNRVDIALDTFPYNGTTTSVEGLWMGVPFITRRGDRFISRVGESIAHNTGLSDWIATDDKDYVAKGLALAADLERLPRLRAGLRRQISTTPLFDARRFARNFEVALWKMWSGFRPAK